MGGCVNFNKAPSFANEMGLFCDIDVLVGF